MPGISFTKKILTLVRPLPQSNPMIIKLSTELVSPDGIALTDGKNPLTLGFVCRTALATNPPQGGGQPPKVLPMDEIYSRGKLIGEMKNDPEITLKSEEVVMLKKLINEIFVNNINIIYSAITLLDG